ncbi:hypothetical protein [Paenibacillus radicis (ex Gao et al. 2016)]|uniref:Uncharacterized protein n=1 Tax=Paenibacillus radicis (ex Gao et al. 2016) TaxID=1737354 RepID=A0A917HPV6_9BACL|nr:hypothetical protein [Paenibacillus radicis (ex Gao et al. 2016)]GGG85406.1 hypothetical protein GCM10010918_49200 [Paenibacillus radicis (ex Gao et al. 2016)]
MIPLFAGQQPDMEVVANGDLRDSEPASLNNEANFAVELVGEGLE